MFEKEKIEEFPMEGALKTMPWLSHLGLVPLVVKDNATGSGSNLAGKKYPFLILHVVFPAILGITGAAMMILDRATFRAYSNAMEEQVGVTNFSVATSLFAIAVGMLGNIVNAFLLAKKASDITELNEQMAASLPKLRDKPTTPQKCAFKFLLTKIVLIVGYTGCQIAWSVFIMVWSGEVVYLGFLVVTLNVMAYMPPSSCMTELITKLHVDHLNRHLEQLMDAPNEEKLIAYGIRITESITAFDACFGKLILLQCGLCFFNDIIFAYYVYLAYDFMGSYNQGLACYIVSCCLMNAHNTWQKVSLHRLGQKLSNCMRTCYLKMQKKRQNRHFLHVDPYKVDLLERRLGDKEPIRPCDTFALNWETLASSYGLLFTYAIVLIQFNISSE